MDIPPILCRRPQRQEQPQEEGLWESLNAPLFYFMSKENQSLSTAT